MRGAEQQLNFRDAEAEGRLPPSVLTSKGEHAAWGVVEDLRKIVRRLQGEKLQVESRLAIVMGERDRAVEQLKNLGKKIEGLGLWTKQLLSCL